MADFARVREERRAGELPLFTHPGWAEAFPWLLQGITARGEGGGFDLRLFGDTPSGEVIGRWLQLRDALGTPRAAHARQVHGGEVLVHGGGPPGLLISERYDGHATGSPGLLLTVSVADCVPIYLLEPGSRRIALLHGGWRGVAAGILERGAGVLAELSGSGPPAFHLHFGPSICGDCYEVGAEVFEALGLAPPGPRAVLDLRRVLAQRALRLGIPERNVSISSYCTRCGDGGRTPFFSHRGGCAQRQVGYMAIAGEPR